MSIKSVYFLLVTICIASSVNAQLPQFPFPFPFPNPFQQSPGGSPGIPGIPWIPSIPGFPKIPGLPFPFPNPFQPSPGGSPGIPGGSPGIPGVPGIPKIPGFPFPFPNPFQPSPGSSPIISDTSGIPKVPGLPDMSKCWSSFMDMPGCFAEIRQSVMTGNFGSIGPACCKAFLDDEANCASNLPFKPIFPPMVKQQCSQAASPPVTL